MKKLNNREIDILISAINQKDFDINIRLMAASVTITEMHFRPWIWRIFEFALAIFYNSIGSSIQKFTLGISQISIKYYCKEFLLTEKQSIIKSMYLDSNLFLCCKVLEQVSLLELNEVCLAYNGKSTIFYRRLLSLNYIKIQNYYKNSLKVKSK